MIVFVVGRMPQDQVGEEVRQLDGCGLPHGGAGGGLELLVQAAGDAAPGGQDLVGQRLGVLRRGRFVRDRAARVGRGAEGSGER
ncbi:hypothetical protein [Nonomuraea recticatena]|uniref:Uncharacterized protein n=1 Tax=Nonomuraea recticatena TaxID=46178 RepID=A0ABP6F4C5_9ACTN